MAEEFATVQELDLTIGGVVVHQLHKSFEGIRTPSTDYEEGLIRVGSIFRAIGPFEQGYSLGSCSIQIHNTDQEQSVLANNYRLIGREQRIKFGRLSSGLAAMRQIFTGKNVDYSVGNAMATYDVRDTGADRFFQQLRLFAKTLSAGVFGDLPAGRPEVLVNIIYGDISTNGGNMTGAGPVPCWLIDDDATGKWRYVVAQHVCKSVDAVYVYGVLAATAGFTYSVTTASYDGVTMTVIDFNTDPRTTTRPNEIEVTCLVKGITDDGTSGGTLLTNPVEQRNHFLTNYAGWDSSEIDSTLSTAAIAAATANMLNGASAPIKTAWIVGFDLNTKIVDILNKLTANALLYTWMTTTGKVGSYILTLTEATTAHSPEFSVSDGGEILRGSFSVRGNRGSVYSSIEFQRVFNWTLGRYAVQYSGSVPVLTGRIAPMPHSTRVAPLPHTTRVAPLRYTSTPTDLSNLGDSDTPDAPAKLISLEMVADENTAISVASVYAMFADGMVRFITFDLPAEYILASEADLNHYCAVTHWQGLSSSGGYVNEVFRIVRTEAFVQPKEKKLRLTCLGLAT